MIEPAALQDLVARWWWNYDEGHFDVLKGLLSEDVHFSCRTDSGATDYEEFVNADVTGRDAVMAWQTEHRLDSPYPLRHNSANVHLVDTDSGDGAFRSYILVTAIAGGIAIQSSALVNGRVRQDGDTLLLAELEVVLDTKQSVPFRDR